MTINGSFLAHRLLAGAMLTATVTAPAEAVTFRFDTDPFAGTTVLETPGRQFVGGELFIPAFDLDEDVIAANPRVFDIAPTVNFFSGLARDLPAAGGLNFIVLLDIDADGDLGNGILNNAGLSANLIADRIDTPGAGFFVYFNSGLNLNRLVYSTDLSSRDADLKIVTRFLDQTGLGAADALPRYTEANFAATVPEPASWALMIAGFGLVGAAARRRQAARIAS